MSLTTLYCVTRCEKVNYFFYSFQVVHRTRSQAKKKATTINFTGLPEDSNSRSSTPDLGGKESRASVSSPYFARPGEEVHPESDSDVPLPETPILQGKPQPDIMADTGWDTDLEAEGIYINRSL